MTTFTVTERGGCRLIKGQVSVSAFIDLVGRQPSGSVADGHAARLLNVDFAVGLPDDLSALCAEPAVIAEAMARARAQVGRVALSEAAIAWLAVGRHGASSRAMFQRLTGVWCGAKAEHPRDPDDLSRCRLLLEQVPELAPHLPDLADLSEVWARLVSAWPGLCLLMDEESPRWREGLGRAPQTARRLGSLAG